MSGKTKWCVSRKFIVRYTGQAKLSCVRVEDGRTQEIALTWWCCDSYVPLSSRQIGTSSKLFHWGTSLSPFLATFSFEQERFQLTPKASRLTSIRSSAACGNWRLSWRTLQKQKIVYGGFKTWRPWYIAGDLNGPRWLSARHAVAQAASSRLTLSPVAFSQSGAEFMWTFAAVKQLANASHAIIALRFVLQFFCTAFIIAWNLCVYSNNIPHTGINEKTGRRFWKETHIVYIFRKTNILYRYMLRL